MHVLVKNLHRRWLLTSFWIRISGLAEVSEFAEAVTLIWYLLP